ncbi:hypothetical protein [Afifella sp. IM 167]|uniref:hypothetical protein n=1 Tax=Afifella sp. IM 167 TaxID=2033586 RepID=UPI001CCCB64F|nr:hypothetical protein [Afifella sp. IM 167]MBZ8133516.1 hypothetical protein [Afifella sp. IM 167]
MRVFLVLLIIVLAIGAYFMVDIRQVQEGRLPEVQVTEGQAPKFEFKLGKFEVVWKTATVSYPTIQFRSPDETEPAAPDDGDDAPSEAGSEGNEPAPAASGEQGMQPVPVTPPRQEPMTDETTPAREREPAPLPPSAEPAPRRDRSDRAPVAPDASMPDPAAPDPAGQKPGDPEPAEIIMNPDSPSQ